ncbi:hypothetical protein LshimejAT787_1802030 [Lyophyllum shimeji]|uniref:Uncharacterized protein n=1 Tax=Lyophyllum shimeji TaxID=47721 RepID=A0A9P3Q196_LYOSH|nr:hypothetical protein LshimejAT787_1802030 [Lyophyllum shimeji]
MPERHQDPPVSASDIPRALQLFESWLRAGYGQSLTQLDSEPPFCIFPRSSSQATPPLTFSFERLVLTVTACIRSASSFFTSDQYPCSFPRFLLLLAFLCD